MAKKHEFNDASRGIRLQKVMAESGIASRRECEQLITEGVVTVNGHVVATMPAWVDPKTDRIRVRGRPLKSTGKLVYVMLFKPRGVVCTSSDEEDRRRAIDLVRHPSKTRLFPVGRLDMDSSGLLLLTNDGELANLLTHPRYHLPKIYEVTVRGRVEAASLSRLEHGLFLFDHKQERGAKTARSQLKILKRDRERTCLLMELREGRNRQVRRMMLDVGHPVKKLRRVQLGTLKLKGLRPGEWRDLTAKELMILKRSSEAKAKAVDALPRKKVKKKKYTKKTTSKTLGTTTNKSPRITTSKATRKTTSRKTTSRKTTSRKPVSRKTTRKAPRKSSRR